MTTETNKIVMRRFLEFINTASEKLAQELISPDAIFHVPGTPRTDARSGWLPRDHRDDARGLPRYSMDAGGDGCRGRQGSRALHDAGHASGHFFGVPPTGKKIEVQAMNFYRLSDGQFVEERGQPDLLGLLQQIGAVPAA